MWDADLRAGVCLACGWLEGSEFGNLDPDLRALAFLAANIHFELVAVEKPQTLVDVADPDTAAVYLEKPIRCHAHAVVVNLDRQPPVAATRADVNLTSRQPRSQPMLNCVLDDRLQQHAGHERVERLLIDFLENLELVAPKADDLDVQIIVDEIKLFPQRNEGLMLPQQPPQNIGKLQHHAASHVRIEADQGGDSVQRVEKEMGIDLAGQGVHARLEQVLLVLLEVHLDARVVPDL